MERTRYDNVALGLHWLIAILIIANICIGLYMADLPRTDAMRASLFAFHKSTGLTVLMLSVLRVIWRLTHPFIALPAGMPALLKFAARASHVTLYVMMIALPLSGWLLTSAGGSHFHYFGTFDFPLLPGFAGIAKEARHSLIMGFGAAHVILAWIMIGLVALHISAALYHGFIRRDGVLGRMVPGL